ncbi:alpha-ribazole transporter [Natronincola peptidivorans]|uniref:Alpha-ribazole transporter n=1 Tax=Natronincola peptidivorans TaxID=426128 RepID=A0A1I0CWQ3_9FIRM|nr:ECF transporter S component [Natronincola peptidivorans]SET24259.1 alpha-ribazole transporter [Natronincola peptidivorans]
MFQQEVKKIYNVRTITKIAMLIAISMIGAMIKIQGSIAFDSMAGFYAAIAISPLAGGLVGLLGHLLSAATAGFPMTLPMHLIVAIEMFLFVYIFGWLYNKASSWMAVLVATLLNGPVAALIVVPTSIMLGLPFSGWPLFTVIWIPLTIASFLNISLATMIHKNISKGIKNEG